MIVVGVTFKKNSKEYYFSSDKTFDLKVDDKVVVDTARGVELATIVNIDIETNKVPIDELAPVVRKATKKDISNYEANLIKAEEGFLAFNKILKDFPDLDMTLVSCEYSLDSSRILFMYVSNDRVDFRELLKALASHFKKRIELMQIGARDKAKIIGGLGPCGMETCCSRYLKEFDNISINMAKNQMLSLNPVKISGLCGRLLCCLKYENETYTEMKKTFPKMGTFVEYEKNNYKVIGLNLLLDQIKIEHDGVIKMIDKVDAKW